MIKGRLPFYLSKVDAFIPGKGGLLLWEKIVFIHEYNGFPMLKGSDIIHEKDGPLYQGKYSLYT
jgi:hypothetical protein